MPYNFLNRLDHASNRMSEVNNECVTFVQGTRQIPLDVSPILISADELNPGGGTPSLIRVERQDWVAWVCANGPNGEKGLGPLYPPAAGSTIVRRDGSRFKVSSMGSDEPPYSHVSTNRKRCIIHTIKVK